MKITPSTQVGVFTGLLTYRSLQHLHAYLAYISTEVVLR